jgi:epoxyqueuosine reductase
MKEKIGNRLYGCDTCQVVCPKNRKKNWTHHPEFEPDPELVKPLLKPLLQMTNKQFKEKYGGISASWRGKKPIERNAIIALGNFKDETAVPVLSDIVLHDVRPDMRGTAAWALGKIGTTDASDTLRIAEGKEQDEQVLAAIHRACLSIQAKKQSD